MGEIVTAKTPELRRLPVAAAIVTTMLHNSAAAESFWRDVARGGDEDEGTPAAVLDAWLTGLREPGAKLVKPPEVYQGCWFAFKAHRDLKTIKTIKHSTAKGFHGEDE